MKFSVLTVVLTLFIAPIIGASLVAAPAATPPRALSLSALFYKAAEAFWSVEPKFEFYDAPFTKLEPLPPNHAAIPRYQRAARAAETFLLAQAARKTPSEGTPVMLYFAAMSYDRIGNHQKTLIYIDRLLREFPDYNRPRVNGDAFFDHPVRADLMHLRMWHARQLTSQPDTLETLSQMAQDTAEIQRLRDQYTRIAQRMPDLDRVARTSDMLRTAALPTALQMTMDAHDATLPTLTKKQGMRATRDYLRTLNRAPLAAVFGNYAIGQLVELDKVILAGYRDDAKKALHENRYGVAVSIYQKMLVDYAGSPVADEAAAGVRNATIGGYRYAAQEAFKSNDFDTAKANWRKISEQFAGSPDAEKAEDELKKIVPVAVKFYRTEGDKNWRVDEPEQFGKPQAKAREFYEKMYREEPDGVQADVALYWWGRGLATEGKPEEAIEKYELFLQRFPKSALMPNALFSRAFQFGSNWNRQYDKAISLMFQLVEKYPKSEKSPDALWYAAFMRAHGQGRFTEARPILEKLIASYPNSIWIRGAREELDSNYQWQIAHGFGT